MATTSVRTGGGVPGQVTAARILVFIQAALELLGALVAAAMARKSGHAAALGVAGAIDLVFGVALLVAGMKMGGCESWTRTLVLGFEFLVILVSIFALIVGSLINILLLATAIAVIALMVTAPARSCFAGR
jgi:small-conductance mechanosensitive channel